MDCLSDLHRIMAEIEAEEGTVMGRDALVEGVSCLFRNTHRSIDSAVEAVATGVHVARGNEPSLPSFNRYPKQVPKTGIQMRRNYGLY